MISNIFYIAGLYVIFGILINRRDYWLFAIRIMISSLLVLAAWWLISNYVPESPISIVFISVMARVSYVVEQLYLLPILNFYLAYSFWVILIITLVGVFGYRNIKPKWEKLKFKWVKKLGGEADVLGIVKRDVNLWRYLDNGCKADDRYFIGSDKYNKPIYLNERQLTSHVQVVGPSGEGKTASVILPFIYQTIKKNRACIFVDGKGDIGVINQVSGFINSISEKEDFNLFIPVYPEISNTYNPLCSSDDPSELTDMLVTALDLNVPGSGKVYSDIQKSFLLNLFNLFISTGKKFNFEDILMFINHLDVREHVYQISNPYMTDEMKTFLKRIKDDMSDLIGLSTVISKLFVYDQKTNSIVNSYEPDIDIKRLLANKRIALFSFSAGKKSQTNEALAKMVLADIANAVGERHMNSSNDFCTIVLDEFGQFAPQNFDKFISTARGANISIVFSHQSNAQLTDLNGSNRLELIVRENSATKIIFRQSEEADYWAKVFGTKAGFKRTDVINEEFVLTEGIEGKGSLREVEEFKIHPNELKGLAVGQAAFKTGNESCILINLGYTKFNAYVHQKKLKINELSTGGLNLKAVHNEFIKRVTNKKSTVKYSGKSKVIKV